jgi:hypothetical protein
MRNPILEEAVVMRVRKRPVEVVAFRVTSLNMDEVGKWCGGTLIFGRSTNGISSESYFEIAIPTLEGDIYAGIGDWVIQGVVGEFYPCRADIFEATYDVLGEL